MVSDIFPELPLVAKNVLQRDIYELTKNDMPEDEAAMTATENYLTQSKATILQIEWAKDRIRTYFSWIE